MMANSDHLITVFESSLSHAQGNYQMIVLEELALNKSATKNELVTALLDANPQQTRTFFNSHCVFKVLKNKKLIKEIASPVKAYSLNLTRRNPADIKAIVASAQKAKKAYEVNHK